MLGRRAFRATAPQASLSLRLSDISFKLLLLLLLRGLDGQT